LSFPKKTRAALLAAAALACLCACGRRGDLEPPSAAAPQAENRHDLQVHRTDRKITPPNKDFVLDPLLK
jgi:predicted small lipoprotein YifL